MESPARYAIRVEGNLDRHWAAWFDGLQVEHRGTDTVILGAVPDQAALHGVLAHVRDLGLRLVSLRRLGPDEVDDG